MSGVCNKTSNNKYFNCPARMDDGRHFTDYRPNSELNKEIIYSNNVRNSYNARQFLISNATKIMELNNENAKKQNNCLECNAKEIHNKTKCVVNKEYSVCYPDDLNGIGIRYVTGNIPVIPYNPQLQKNKLIN